ncbi:hypothetical protein P153DRAFT_386153 [Dothidotthia symphoricarpi CBS 119687]|uniref:Uncharacterized protein n=1 Tax=Dothidotthia symphoricarpi CBS 119687 TaxID=1392245 RepID=A0A6A6ACI7_9PLEO|nr:uncharacterized protein P153DRAFT_386153 [Dothidotthia symphoricarpi CBS 119687]KAF2128953.1 hypothetical protein P153DRAFT_386153 [Dothidotthia symphoricarpi CBS 119687]
MGSTTQSSDTLFEFGSSSSNYDESDSESQVDSTGTLVHQRSHMLPKIGGFSLQNAMRPSYTSLEQAYSFPNPDGGNLPGRDDQGSSYVQYRFGTPREEEERLRGESDRASARVSSQNSGLQASFAHMQQIIAEGNAWNVTEAPLGQGSLSNDRTADLDHEAELLGPYHHTSSRLRDDVTNEDYQSHRGRRDIMAFDPAYHVRRYLSEPEGSEVGDQLEQEREGAFQNTLPSSNIRPDKTISPSLQPLFPSNRWSESEYGMSNSNANTLHRYNDRNFDLQPMPDFATSASSSDYHTNPGHSRNRGSPGESKQARHHRRSSWRDNLTDQVPMEGDQTATSDVRQQYGTGSSTRGYLSGVFVTFLPGPANEQEDITKKSLLRRIVCA